VKGKLLEEIAKKAVENDKHGGCSQSVLLALQESLNIGNTESFKSATVLSGGVAKNGETCGALIGGLLALGLVIGREKIEDTEVYKRAIDVANEIIEKFKVELRKGFNFKKELTNTLCRDIQERIYGRSFDLRTPEGYQAFLHAGGHTENGCLKVCGVAAKTAAEKILEIKEKNG